MICEAAEFAGQSFFMTWLVLTIGGGSLSFGLSMIAFRKWYWAPTFEQWQNKSNPKYPRPSQVRKEVLLTIKCLSLSTLCPAMSIYLVAHGHSQAFCGWGDRSLMWHICSFLAMLVFCDFYEWGYHGLGHAIPFLWKQHKNHHLFYNPTPFAVVADEAIDQLVRSAPMLFIPVLFPTNMDVLFMMFAALFYAYGVYMHGGHEFEWPDAHHPIINTSYQHYLHHSVGGCSKPAHTGFFVKIWDQLCGDDLTAEMYKAGKCTCAKCSRARGERSLEAWQAVEKQDHSVLLKPSFWLTGKDDAKDKAAAEKVAAAGGKTE